MCKLSIQSLKTCGDDFNLLCEIQNGVDKWILRSECTWPVELFKVGHGGLLHWISFPAVVLMVKANCNSLLQSVCC